MYTHLDAYNWNPWSDYILFRISEHVPYSRALKGGFRYSSNCPFGPSILFCENFCGDLLEHLPQLWWNLAALNKFT